MTHIRITKGFDLPLEGVATGEPVEVNQGPIIGHDYSHVVAMKLKLLVREGDRVSVGTPLVCERGREERLSLSRAAGVVEQIVRGEKRKIIAVVVRCEGDQNPRVFDPVDLQDSDAVQKRALDGGCFFSIFKRPCHTLATPMKRARSIFVKAIESAPYAPDPMVEISLHSRAFRKGLEALTKLTEGEVHLVTAPEFNSDLVGEIKGVKLHTASGPHPIANSSVHIEAIDPIQSNSDIVWTVDTDGVIELGYLMLGEIQQRSVISIAGIGIVESHRKYYHIYKGAPVSQLIESKKEGYEGDVIIGNPLCGRRMHEEGYVGVERSVVRLPTAKKRQIVHFLGFGWNRFSITRSYLGTFKSWLKGKFPFTNLLHGEQRAFIDGRLYDRVMPLRVPTMPLLKALITDDYDSAIELGLLEVAPEDFALSAFICPSKIDHIGIVRRGLDTYASQYID